MHPEFRRCNSLYKDLETIRGIWTQGSEWYTRKANENSRPKQTQLISISKGMQKDKNQITNKKHRGIGAQPEYYSQQVKGAERLIKCVITNCMRQATQTLSKGWFPLGTPFLLKTRNRLTKVECPAAENGMVIFIGRALSTVQGPEWW